MPEEIQGGWRAAPRIDTRHRQEACSACQSESLRRCLPSGVHRRKSIMVLRIGTCLITIRNRRSVALVCRRAPVPCTRFPSANNPLAQFLQNQHKTAKRCEKQPGARIESLCPQQFVCPARVIDQEEQANLHRHAPAKQAIAECLGPAGDGRLGVSRPSAMNLRPAAS